MSLCRCQIQAKNAAATGRRLEGSDPPRTALSKGESPAYACGHG